MKWNFCSSRRHRLTPRDEISHKSGKVARQRAAIEMLKGIEAIRDILRCALADQERGKLIDMFGGDCARIARTRSVLDTVMQPFSGFAGSLDDRVPQCLKACEAVETLLEDLGLCAELTRAKEREKRKFLEETESDEVPLPSARGSTRGTPLPSARGSAGGTPRPLGNMHSDTPRIMEDSVYNGHTKAIPSQPSWWKDVERHWVALTTPESSNGGATAGGTKKKSCHLEEEEEEEHPEEWLIRVSRRESTEQKQTSADRDLVWSHGAADSGPANFWDLLLLPEPTEAASDTSGGRSGWLTDEERRCREIEKLDSMPKQDVQSLAVLGSVSVGLIALL